MEPSRWTSPPEARSQQLLLKVVPFKMVFTPVAVEALEGLAEQNRISKGNTPPQQKQTEFFVHTLSKFTPANREKPNN